MHFIKVLVSYPTDFVCALCSYFHQKQAVVRSVQLGLFSLNQFTIMQHSCATVQDQLCSVFHPVHFLGML